MFRKWGRRTGDDVQGELLKLTLEEYSTENRLIHVRKMEATKLLKSTKMKKGKK